MEVINPKISKFILVFGQANNATTGAGNDGAPQGKLDVMYAESELEPADSIKGFDARWTIPSTNGTLWNILPPADNPAFYGSSIDLTSKSDKDTVTFKWYRFDVPDQSDAAKNPKGLKWFICDGETGGAKFKYDMRSLSTILNADGASEIATNNNIGELTAFGTAYKFVIKGEKPGSNSANEYNSLNRAEIYPNPAGDFISININGPGGQKVIAEVFDRLGRMVASAEFTDGTNGNNHAIDVSGLAPGAYVIRIHTGREMICEMFIKN